MKLISTSVIYENPLPILKSIQSAFPSICELDDGEILASHQLGEAFESVDKTSYVSRSVDGGKTFLPPKQMFNKKRERPIRSDCCKLTKLKNGNVMALGYQFLRKDKNLPIGNGETGGLLDDEVFFSVSKDNGNTWSKRKVIKCAWGPHVEASAPIYELADGSLATPITGFADWNGNKTLPADGRLLRSFDNGRTFNDDVICMEFEDKNISCFEQRMCQLDNGDLVVIGWNENLKTGELLCNHYTISKDNGKTFSKPESTGIKGQASSVLALGGNKILALHCLRRDCENPGIYGYIVDLSEGKWNIKESALLWAPNVPVLKDKNMAGVFAFLKFGQPTAIKLKDGRFLMSFWACENGQYKTYCSKIEL